MLSAGQVITLSNGKEYMIVDKMSLHSINYLYLMTTSKPLDILIVTEKKENGNIILSEIKDNSELEYIMNRFIFEK